MLGIRPSYTGPPGSMAGCSECQYCRYLQCHGGNSPGCRGGPWLCPSLQHCGHTAPRASPVALILPLDLHRPLNDYNFPLQLPFRQHTTHENKEDPSGMYAKVPQEYKKVFENYASNSKYDQMNNCEIAQRDRKIQNNNQNINQEQCRNIVQEGIKQQNNKKISTVNKGSNNIHKDQKPKDSSRHLESQAVQLPAIPEGIGVDADVKGRSSSKPIDIPKNKDHVRRKLDNQSPIPSTNTKNPKKLMDINTCTVSQINQWSNKVLTPQNIKQTKANKKDEDKRSRHIVKASSNENQGFPIKEPHLIQAHSHIRGHKLSSSQAAFPISKAEIPESEINDYLTSYKVNQDVKLNDVGINEGFYSVKPISQKGIDNDQIGLDTKSPITINSRPESSFLKDSGNCSDVSSSSVNLGDKSISSNSIKPHCQVPDYSYAGGVVSGVRQQQDLVAPPPSGEGGGSAGEDSELGAYWELLEDDIRPMQPLKHSQLSHQIFLEHKEMARKYLILQQELFNLQRQKSLLKEKLSHSEQLEQCTNHRYQERIRQLMGKRDSLSNNHAHLKQQLERIRNQGKRPQLPFTKATPQDITVGSSLQLHHPRP